MSRDRPSAGTVRLGLEHWIIAGGIAAAVGTLYFATAARDIVVGDTAELITAAVTLGVAHPPGYPLFTILGHVFSLLPFSSIPFRVNLLGVVCGTARRLRRLLHCPASNEVETSECGRSLASRCELDILDVVARSRGVSIEQSAGRSSDLSRCSLAGTTATNRFFGGGLFC